MDLALLGVMSPIVPHLNLPPSLLVGLPAAIACLKWQVQYSAKKLLVNGSGGRALIALPFLFILPVHGVITKG